MNIIASQFPSRCYLFKELLLSRVLCRHAAISDFLEVKFGHSREWRGGGAGWLLFHAAVVKQTDKFDFSPGGGGGHFTFQDTGLCHSNRKSTTHKSGEISQSIPIYPEKFLKVYL